MGDPESDGDEEPGFVSGIVQRTARRRPRRSWRGACRRMSGHSLRKGLTLAAHTPGESFIRPFHRRVSPLSPPRMRSEEHTSELQSLMRISYAVFCLKNKRNPIK